MSSTVAKLTRIANSPFQFVTMLTAILMGFTAVFIPRVGPASLGEVLHQPWLCLWGGLMLVGGLVGVFAMIGVRRSRNVLLEMASHVAVGIGSATYSYAIFYRVPFDRALMTGTLLGLIALACFWRWAHLRRRLDQSLKEGSKAE